MVDTILVTFLYVEKLRGEKKKAQTHAHHQAGTNNVVMYSGA